MSLCQQRLRSQPVWALALLLAALLDPTSKADDARSYDVRYDIEAGRGATYRVAMQVRQSSNHLRAVTITNPPSHMSAFASDRGLSVEGDALVWTPETPAARLEWTVDLEAVADKTMHQADRWAVMRFEDLIPPMATRTVRGADARTEVRFAPRKGWSVISAYRKSEGAWTVEDARRRFDRPDGWIVTGDLSVRRDQFSGTRVAIAAPKGAGARQLDTMAFIGWHMPQFRRLFPEFPKRLLIAMAGDPMFRGGLSAPNSLFLHIDRPLISGNGTSTLLHELFHIGLGRRAGPGDDWIVEGLAEYYSQKMLAASGSVSPSRHRRAMAWFEEYGQSAVSIKSNSARGPITWRAVGIFDALDREIRRATAGAAELDRVVALLAEDSEPLTLERLRSAVAQVMGQPAKTISDGELPL